MLGGCPALAVMANMKEAEKNEGKIMVKCVKGLSKDNTGGVSAQNIKHKVRKISKIR